MQILVALFLRKNETFFLRLLLFFKNMLKISVFSLVGLCEQISWKSRFFLPLCVFYGYPIILYRANLSSSCFTPTLRNFIVAFAFSPLPSTLMTSPTPNLSCSIICPTRKGLLPTLAADAGAADGDTRCNLCGTMRRGGSCGVGVAPRILLVSANVGTPAGACGRGVLFIYVVLSPSMRM